MYDKRIWSMSAFAVATALSLFLLGNVAHAFTIAVSPPRFEEELTERPQTHVLKVINQGRKPTSVRIRVGHFDLDEENRVREIEPTEQSLDQWMIVRPLAFDLAPGEAQTVRFAIRPYTRPADGEHRAMIFVEQDPITDPEEANTLRVSYRLGVAVYGNAGSQVRKTELHGIELSADGFALDITSSGNVHSRVLGRYGVWKRDSFPGRDRALALIASAGNDARGGITRPDGATHAGHLPSLPVLPGYRRTIASVWPEKLTPGQYVAVFRGRVGERSMTQSVPFDVE